MAVTIKVYVETGAKRTFVGAIDWPGWCRSGKDVTSALQSLLEYGPRYAAVLRGSGVPFSAPKSLAALKVVERLKGDATTDFGAPGSAPKADGRKNTASELHRLKGILAACWRALDAATVAARGKKLRKGPRGGGRDLSSILEHLVGSQDGYIGSLGWWASPGRPKPRQIGMSEVRTEALKGMDASMTGQIPAIGPRGGKRWSARYFARRSAWHILDHAWEIEDRIEQGAK